MCNLFTSHLYYNSWWIQCVFDFEIIFIVSCVNFTCYVTTIQWHRHISNIAALVSSGGAHMLKQFSG